MSEKHLIKGEGQHSKRRNSRKLTTSKLQQLVNISVTADFCGSNFREVERRDAVFLWAGHGWNSEQKMKSEGSQPVYYSNFPTVNLQQHLGNKIKK